MTNNPTRPKNGESCVSAAHVPLFVVALLATLAADNAAAQTMYRCTSGNSVVMSDRPCPGQNAQKIGTNAPAGNTPVYPTSSQYAPEYLQYMSSSCARLNEAVRTGYSRGLRSDAMERLRVEYRSACQDEEYEALSQAQQKTRDQREQRSREKQEERQQAARSTQCQELERILRSRRQRMQDLTPGERDDLVRFLEQYKERCPVN